jgi:hypothetical protein
VDHLVVTLSSTTHQIGGPPITVTVEARDQFDNLTNPATLVTLSLTPGDPGAVITPNPGSFTNGVATFALSFGTVGTYTVTATTGAISQNAGPVVVTNVPVPPPPPPPSTDDLSGRWAVGSGLGGSSEVQVRNPDGSIATATNGTPLVFTPFPAGFEGQIFQASPGFTGDIRTAVADVTGDGVPDIVVGSGSTIIATVLVVDGATGQTIFNYKPYGSFTGGVFVAVGDVNGDGIADIVITPDQGGGPRVQVLRGGDFVKLADFLGIRDENFRGGARAGVGDMNGDGFADLAVSAGFLGGPRISIWDGKLVAQNAYLNLTRDFFVFDPVLRNGAYVALGDVNGDGFADLIAGAGPGGGPEVKILDGVSVLSVGGDLTTPFADFFAGNINNRGGIRVAAKNLDGDRYADLLVGDGEGGGSLVTAYKGLSLQFGGQDTFYAIDAYPGLTSGVFVG